MRDRKKRPWAHWAEKGGAGPGGPDEKGGAVHGGSGREESAEPGRGGTGPCREGRGHVPLDCEERGGARSFRKVHVLLLLYRM